MPWAAAAVVSLAATAAGCGDDDFSNRERAPAPITVSAVIAPRAVTVSPAGFGAGVIELIASNQTATSQRSRTLAGDRAPVAQRTGPINPGDTASLKADLTQGTYVLSASSGAIAPATVEVGRPRPSGRDRLLQP